MIDEAEKFFLSGAEEPVAFEFAIDEENRKIVFDKLQAYGLDVTTNPRELDKILVSRDGVISPVLKPEDVIPLYDLMKQALDGIYIACYPHLIDLQYLAERHQEDKRSEIRKKYQTVVPGRMDFLDFMLDKARHSGQVISTKEPLMQDGVIFGGSMVPDPYTPVTFTARRNFRYATSDADYATGYTLNDGMYTFKLITPGQQQIGFLYAYQAAKNQMFCGQIGLESKGYASRHISMTPETIVNRFHNPCIGRYLVWNERGLHLFKIPEDDEMWRDFLQMFPIRKDVGNMRFALWAEQGKEVQTFLPVLGDVASYPSLEQYAAHRQEMYNQELAQQIEQLKDTMQALPKRIGRLAMQLQQIKVDLDKVQLTDTWFGDTSYHVLCKRDRQLERCRQFLMDNQDVWQKAFREAEAVNQVWSETKTQLEERHERCQLPQDDRIFSPKNISELRDTVREIYSDKMSDSFSSGKLQERIKKLFEQIEQRQATIQEQKKNSVSLMISEIKREKRMCEHVKDFADLPTAERRKMFNVANEYLYRGNPSVTTMEALFLLYDSASYDERRDMIQDLYSLRKAGTKKENLRMRDCMKETYHNLVLQGYLENCPELVELTKTDYPLFKHSTKAVKMAQER